MPRDKSNEKLDSLSYVNNHLCFEGKAEYWKEEGYGILARYTAFEETVWQGGGYETFQEAIDGMAEGLREFMASLPEEDETENQ